MKRSVPFMAAAFTACVILSSCKKKDDNPALGKGHQASSVSFTIDGDGFVSKEVTINGQSDVLENSATYFLQWGYTSATVGDQAKEGDGNKNSMSLYFDGKSIGTQVFGTAFANDGGVQTSVNMILSLQNGGSSVYYGSASDPSDPLAGSVHITSYGDVNGLISGEFSGTFTDPSTGNAVTIQNGKFSVQRIIDTKI